MSYIVAYSICTTLMVFVTAMAAMRKPDDAPSPFSKAVGAGLFALFIVGICALAANGLVAIVEALT